MLQWKQADAVTSARVFSLIHFQKTTASDIWCAFILLLRSMLKICRACPLRRARILAAGFMIAASAVMGRFSVLAGFISWRK
jgi:hypothetical protein